MGKYLEKFKNGAQKVDDSANKIKKKREKERKKREQGADIMNGATSDEYLDDSFDINDDGTEYFNELDSFEDTTIQPAQKPESFHHYILENKYKDLERSIRGFKDVYDKDRDEWVTKRKEVHCFTDEEAEDILRMAQSHLSSDIKLANMSLDAFHGMMTLIYEQLESYFRRIAEYRYGRYNKFSKNRELLEVRYDLQGKMKDVNKKILIELYNRIWANYSRAIKGNENRLTHTSVRGQESLQQTDQDAFNKDKRYT